MLASLLGFFLAIDVMVGLSVGHSPCHHLRIRSLEIQMGMEMGMALASASLLRLPWVHQSLPLLLKIVDKVKNKVKTSVKLLYGKKRS
jgi:hypothetical protein